MKVPILLSLGVALTFTSVAARADGLFLTVPLVPGPSAPRQNPAPPPPRAPLPPLTTSQPRKPDPTQVVPVGERDAAGRIGPSVQAERGPDGKLPPTQRLR